MSRVLTTIFGLALAFCLIGCGGGGTQSGRTIEPTPATVASPAGGP